MGAVPHTDSVRARLRRFFLANPGEELTIEQATEKFAVSQAAVYNALKLMPEMEHVRVIRTTAKGRGLEDFQTEQAHQSPTREPPA